MMRFRLASPPLLVDINRLEGLSYIREEDGWLKIGAMTREAELDRSDLIRSKYPLLADTTRLIADPLVRNLATLGGNLAHADPANDHPATMLAYGAQLVAQGPNGEREIPADEFFVGPFTSALAENEILTEIRIPTPDANSGGTYLKVERRVGDYATAAVAVQLSLNQDATCSEIGLGLTNVGLTPIKARAAMDSLRGETVDDERIRQAARLASEAAEPEEDQRGSVEYKRALVGTLTVRALRRSLEMAKGGQ